MPIKTAFDSLLDRFRFLLPARYRVRPPIVPVVRLSGAIGAVSPFRPGLSIASTATVLERAFAVKGAKAVALVVNSPGGSAAQSHLIFKRIRSLSVEKNLPVLVFVEDAAASGGYMIACAGDEIFVDPSSLMGSIGVVFAGFGFQELIQRYGVERRIYTAGESKAMLDPFRPENPEDVAKIRRIQGRIHEIFIDLVRSRRAGRLNLETPDLFSGAVWSGTEAVELGLADGVGDIRTVLRERYGEKVRIAMMPQGRTSLLARLLGRGAASPDIGGGGLVDPDALIGAVEERLLWSRLGL
ncbi:MAG TPA: S49 family peptidase [Beijerinckiaceae bacterium]|jgi:signal peptide peptidase SppA